MVGDVGGKDVSGDGVEGGGEDNQNVHAEFAKILLTIYLSIYLYI